MHTPQVQTTLYRWRVARFRVYSILENICHDRLPCIVLLSQKEYRSALLKHVKVSAALVMHPTLALISHVA